METQDGAHDRSADSAARRRSVIGDGGNADSGRRTRPVTADSGTGGNAPPPGILGTSSRSCDAEPGAGSPVIARGGRSTVRSFGVSGPLLAARPGYVCRSARPRPRSRSNATGGFASRQAPATVPRHRGWTPIHMDSLTRGRGSHLPHHGALVLPWLRLATLGYFLSPYAPMYVAETPLGKRESRSVPRRIARAWRSGNPLISRCNRRDRRGSPENPGLSPAPAACRTDTRSDFPRVSHFPKTPVTPSGASWPSQRRPDPAWPGLAPAGQFRGERRP